MRRFVMVGIAMFMAASAVTGAASAEPGSDAGLAQRIIEAAQFELAAAEQADGPIVGMPPIEDLLVARMDVWTNPVYWSNYVQEVLLGMNFQQPAPTDPVKPEAFLPNVPVANGEYVSDLPFSEHDVSGVTYEWEGRTKTVEDYLYTNETDVMVFAVNGAIADEFYANGYNSEVRHQPWSVTKTFVAAIVGIAFDEGLITSLQDPIEQYIPDLAGTAWEGATIENILQMESGVHWDEDTPVLVVNTQVEQWVQVGLDYYTQGQLGQTRNEFLAALPAAYEQGTEFRYNSGNTQVLAWMLERLYGNTFNEIVSEKLWIPMGAYGDAVMITDREGAVLASQGLYARPYDFLRFGELLRNGGVTPEGHRVVPADWIVAMTTMTDVSDGAYGLQTWAAPTAGKGAYTGIGFEGQQLTVVPDQCVTAVRLGHSIGADLRRGDDPTDPNSYGFEVEMGELEWETLLAAVAAEIGGCTTAAGDGNAVPVSDADVEPAPPSLPATGGGLGLVALPLAAYLTRRRRIRAG